MERIIHITTSSDDREELRRIARRLLEERLASCVQILGPMTSLYWWKGSIEETGEWLAIIKTTRGLYGMVEEEILRLHHYDLPEIMAFEADQALDAYGRWVVEEIRERGDSGQKGQCLE